MMNVKRSLKQAVLISVIAAMLLCLAGCTAAAVMNMSSGKTNKNELLNNNPFGNENKDGDLIIGEIEADIKPYNNHTGEENYIWELSATLESGDVLSKIYNYHNYYVVEPELHYADLISKCLLASSIIFQKR